MFGFTSDHLTLRPSVPRVLYLWFGGLDIWFYFRPSDPPCIRPSCFVFSTGRRGSLARGSWFDVLVLICLCIGSRVPLGRVSLIWMFVGFGWGGWFGGLDIWFYF